MEELIKDELLRDEKILWAGQPETTVIFTEADILLIPFALLWGGAAVILFFEILVGALKTTVPITVSEFLLDYMFVSAFALLGVYFLFGRFFWKNYKKRRTFYFITNKRVIVLANLLSKHIQASFIDSLPSINKSVRPDGIGTIHFGSYNAALSCYGNTGMDFFGSFYAHDIPIFYDISNVNQVCELVNGIRNK